MSSRQFSMVKVPLRARRRPGGSPIPQWTVARLQWPLAARVRTHRQHRIRLCVQRHGRQSVPRAARFFDRRVRRRRGAGGGPWPRRNDERGHRDHHRLLGRRFAPMRANDREHEHERDQPRCDRDRREPETAHRSQRITGWDGAVRRTTYQPGAPATGAASTRMPPRFHRPRRPAIDRPRRGNVVRSSISRPKAEMLYERGLSANCERYGSIATRVAEVVCAHGVASTRYQTSKASGPLCGGRRKRTTPRKCRLYATKAKSQFYEQLVALVLASSSVNSCKPAASTVSPSTPRSLGGAKLQSSISTTTYFAVCGGGSRFFDFKG